MDPAKIIAGQEDLLIIVTPQNKTGGPAHVESGSTKAISNDQAAMQDGVIQGDDTGVEVTLLCVSLGAVGATGMIDVSADADLGAGVETISVQIPFELVANPEDTKAVTLGVAQAKGVPKA